MAAFAIFVRGVVNFGDDVAACRAYDTEDVVCGLDWYVFHFEDHYFLCRALFSCYRFSRRRGGLGFNAVRGDFWFVLDKGDNVICVVVLNLLGLVFWVNG